MIQVFIVLAATAIGVAAGVYYTYKSAYQAGYRTGYVIGANTETGRWSREELN